MDSGKDVVPPCAAAASLKHAFKEETITECSSVFVRDHSVILKIFFPSLLCKHK